MKSFDERVWEIIRTIPPGRLMTYGGIARRLGTRAYRAVGAACARSPGMPLVPCHRVVDAGGLLHGFNNGIEAKRALLEKEGILLKKRARNQRIDYRVVDLSSISLDPGRDD